MADFTDVSIRVFGNRVLTHAITYNDQPPRVSNNIILFPASGSSPGPAATQYINRVFDTVEGGLVPWVTTGIDDTGASYPGPGTFGVDTSGFAYSIIIG